MWCGAEGAPIPISEDGLIDLRRLLSRSINEKQRLILQRVWAEPGPITSLLRKLSRRYGIPLSTLKLNARLLREMGLLKYGSKSKPREAELTELGQLVLQLLYEAPPREGGIEEVEEQVKSLGRLLRGLVIPNHLASNLSALPILAVLYIAWMRHDPMRPEWEERDRLILSKGHAAPALYAFLAHCGYLEWERLKKIGEIEGLPTHPELSISGVEFSSGSLGQGLSFAVGLALAAKINGLRYRVYALLGDGELDEGQVWEAAMTASALGLDNLTAIIDRNDLQLTGPTEEVKPLEPLAEKWRSFGWVALEVEATPMALLSALGRLEGVEKPAVIIADTRDAAAAGRPTPRWLDGETSMREVFGRKLVELGETLDELVVLDADVSTSTRTCYFSERFPSRFFNLGIAEQDLIGVAAGLAAGGLLPVATGFATFLVGRGWEQIKNTIARQNLNVKIVATHAGLSDHLDGASHQSIADITLMRALPRVNVLVPADAPSAAWALEAAVMHRGPIYLRLGRDDIPIIYDEDLDHTLGKAEVLREGDDVSLIACGVMVHAALEAAEILEEGRIKASVIDMHTVKPLDRDAVRRAAETGGIVTAEEHSIIGGLGSAVAETLMEMRPTSMRRIGIPDRFGVSSRSYGELLRYMGLTSQRIAEAAEELLEGGRY